jgi:cell division protein FtsI/penicillin-binding protein 2
VTPLQAVVAVAAIANNGIVLKPVITELGKKGQAKRKLNYSEKNFQAIRRAMRETVLSGTTQSMNFDFVKIATKSGTAQIKNNKRVNS